MARHAWWIVAILFITGCLPTPAEPKPKKSSISTSSNKVEMPEKSPADLSATPPEKKADLPPAQTFTPPEDKELAALKEVPVEELVTRLGDEKQRELATRALVERGEAAAEPLTKGLEASDPQARAAAAFALGQLGKEAASATAALKKIAESDDSEIARDAATFALDALEGK